MHSGQAGVSGRRRSRDTTMNEDLKMLMIMFLMALVICLVNRANGAENVGADSKPFFKDTFANLENWQVEKWEDNQVQVTAQDGQLKIDTQSKLNGTMVWCRKTLPKNFEFEYDVTPKSKSGFFMIFFCAKGNKGEDI